MKNQKLVPIIIVAVGLLGSLLPFVSRSASGENAALVEAAQKQISSGGNTAWTFGDTKKPGMVLLGVLGVLGALGGAIAATRVNRWLALPLVLVAALGSLIGISMMKGYRSSETLPGDTVMSSSPGLGMMLMVLAIVTAGLFGLYGIIKPEPRQVA